MKSVTAFQLICLAGALFGDPAPVLAGNDGSLPYKVTMTGYVVSPSDKSMPTGEVLHLKEHDKVLIGSLHWFNSTKLPNPVTVHAVGIDFVIPANANLRLAVGPEGGDIFTLSPEAIIYCEEPKNDTVKSLAHAATLGLTSLGGRLARDTQTCLVDSDGNQEFDKAFIVGTKKAEDRHMVDIAPVRYEPKLLDPVSGESRLEVEFFDGGVLNGPSLGMGLKVGGASTSFAALHFFPLNGLSSGRTRTTCCQAVKIKKLPMTVHFGSASIRIDAFDPKARTATATIISGFDVNGFVVESPPQMIYIFY